MTGAVQLAGQDLSSIIGLLARGLPVVIPTDTVYGLALMVGEDADPGILFEVKGRPAEKAIPWLVSSLDQLAHYTSGLPDWAWRLAEQHWPGGLTLVAKASAAAPAAFVADDGTLALRMPNHPLVLGLIAQLQAPLATTSANLSGQAAVNRAADLDSRIVSRVAGVLADPDEHPGRPPIASTVVSCLNGQPVVLRQGVVEINQPAPSKE